MRHITPVLLLATGLISPCFAAPVTPNFTSGTITSETKTRTEVVETIKQIEYSTGTSYTVTGTNINTNGQAFSFSESSITADTAVTTQSVSGGTIASPNLYGNSTTQLGGDKGSLAGTLSPTGVPTITAGGPGSTGTAQRTVELSVFK